MPYSNVEVAEYSKRIGKSVPTLWRWIRQGCNLRDPKSVQEWVTRNTIRETNISKARKRRRANQSNNITFNAGPQTSCDQPRSDLPPIGKQGAAAPLERLEASEEEAHRRLQAALLCGDPVQVAACQDFWLKCSETLRRLDLAVEIARRQEETQISLKTAEETIVAATEWMRIAFTTFLSSEALALMGIRCIGEWKHYAFTRFKGILDLTVKNSLKTRSPVPDWANRRIRDAWNVS